MATIDSLLKDFGFGSKGDALKFVGKLGESVSLNLSGRAALAQGEAIAFGKGVEAESMRRRGQLGKAIAQRRGIAETKAGELVESALIARAAAGGGGSIDPGVLKMAGDIAAEADYRRRVALAEGDIQAADLEYGAQLRELEGAEALRAGKRARRGARFKAGVSALMASEHLSLFDKFGEGLGTSATPPKFRSGTPGKSGI